MSFFPLLPGGGGGGGAGVGQTKVHVMVGEGGVVWGGGGGGALRCCCFKVRGEKGRKGIVILTGERRESQRSSVF